jgi:hypothetical protein
MKMVSMKHEAGEGEAVPIMGSQYPYGLRLTLNQEQLEALGLPMPQAGTKLRIEAETVVTRSSTEDPDADGDVDYVCVELQLTELGVEQGEEESGNAVDERDEKASRLYGKSGK